jgi:hypothetical protein
MHSLTSKQSVSDEINAESETASWLLWSVRRQTRCFVDSCALRFDVIISRKLMLLYHGSLPEEYRHRLRNNYASSTNDLR